MPSLRTKQAKPAPDRIYVCWNSFSAEKLPAPIRAGERLRGSDPAVQRYFHYFVGDGTRPGSGQVRRA
jgi:hypothetical protein